MFEGDTFEAGMRSGPAETAKDNIEMFVLTILQHAPYQPLSRDQQSSAR
ncbi:hypothetical protein [Devosia rhizoryzae]|nr:hypothetical protein [Devosia rhizoryzae]